MASSNANYNLNTNNNKGCSRSSDGKYKDEKKSQIKRFRGGGHLYEGCNISTPPKVPRKQSSDLLQTPLPEDIKFNTPITNREVNSYNHMKGSTSKSLTPSSFKRFTPTIPNNIKSTPLGITNRHTERRASNLTRLSKDTCRTNSVTPVLTNVRKSIENINHNTRSNLRRISSTKRSVFHYQNNVSTKMASCPNTPINNLSQHDQRLVGVDDTEFNIGHEEELSRIVVGVRVRPINNRERLNPNIRNIVEMEENNICVNCENGSIYSFSYDHCMWSCDTNHANYASQENVYMKMAQPLIHHVYEGYNVSVFAYGQTGSGKSYCIMGEENESLRSQQNIFSEAGIIPRFCHDLFKTANDIHLKNETQNSKNHVIVEVSYIEIYNEKIYDLIGCNCLQNGKEKMSECHYHGVEKKEALRVREHPETGPYVAGAARHVVSTYEDLQTWMILGNKQRSISATGMNDRSSRSHSVFSVIVTQTKVETIEDEEMKHSLKSTVNIIDLAGTERLAASNPEWDRLKEGVCINKSLLTLGKVITALAEYDTKRKTFVPYRESVLTWLLKESLGGNSKTAMIATVSPCNIHQEETMSTLRFACQAQKITNRNYINENSTSKVIRMLKFEVERLRALKMSNADVEIVKPSDGDSDEADNRKEAVRLKEQEINILKEKLRINEEQLTQSARIWEEKLKESEMKKNEALDRCRLRGLALKMEDNQPTLINLCEDAQFSQLLLYTLKDGTTTLGQSDSDVVLPELHEKNVHCSVVFEGEKLLLYPKENMEIYVNGILVTSPTEVFHNDRIVIAGMYFFRVCYPSKAGVSSEDGKKLDFFYAKEEIIRVQEERLRDQLLQQQENEKLKMMEEMTQDKETLMNQIKSLASQLDTEKENRKDAELEKTKLEHAIQFYEDNYWHRNNSVVSESNSPLTDNHFFQEIDAVFNESMQIVESAKSNIKTEDIEMHYKINEANKICKHLNKPYEFRQQSRLTQNGLQQVIIVYDLDHNLAATVSFNQLNDFLQILSDPLADVDDQLFETSVDWVRSEEISRMPLVINRLKENVRRSSLGTHHNSLYDQTRKSRNRRSLNQSAIFNSLTCLPSNLHFKRSLAKSLFESLQQPANSKLPELLLHKIIFKLIKFKEDLMAILKHSQQPANEMKLDEDEALTSLVKCGISAKSLFESFEDIISSQDYKTSEKSLELLSKVESSFVKINCKFMRIMQGVSTESVSLIKDEGSSLLKLIPTISEHIAILSVCDNTSVIQTAIIISDMEVCSNYLKGIKEGIEWQIKSTAKSVQILADSFIKDSCSNEGLIKNASQDAAQQIANFLVQYSQLKVIPSSYSDSHEVNRFLCRITSASDNIQQLFNNLRILKEQIGIIEQKRINFSILSNSINRLQDSLRELFEDANIGISYKKHSSTRDSSFDSQTSIDTFLENLRQLATKCVKSVKSLRLSLLEYEEQIRTTSPTKICRTIEIPEKSKWKKVRFNVSLESTLTANVLEESD